jgi:DNA polymerase I
MDIEQLIHGKAGLKKVVGIEVNNGTAEIFQQSENGNVTGISVPNRYWILASSNLDGSFNRLSGNLHYKWGKQFLDKKEWTKWRSIWNNMNEDIYSIWNPEEALMVKDGYTFFRDMKHNDISILSFDIETNGVVKNKDAQVVLISNTYRNHNGNITRKLFSYDEYKNQQYMISSWCDWVREIDPTLLVGHNVYGFDLPFLSHCTFGEGLRLGRNGSLLEFSSYPSEFRKDGSQSYTYNKARCYGRTIVDTMFLAIKYDVSRKYESYGLKSIIREEGLEKKNRVFYDASQIRFHYTNPEEMVKIKEYAKDDADDALALYDLMVAPFFYMSQSIPKTFQEVLLSATGSQINSILMRAYLQDKHSLPKADKMEGGFQGAISYGHAGIFRNCLKIDVASLYPSIISEYSVYCKDKDPNAYFLQLCNFFLTERLKNKQLYTETKDRYFDDLQGAQKIVANSMYGFMGANGLLFNYLEGAAFVTETGRDILQFTIKWASGKNHELHIQDIKLDE